MHQGCGSILKSYRRGVSRLPELKWTGETHGRQHQYENTRD